MQTYIQGVGKQCQKNSEIDPKIRRKSDKIQDQVDPKWSQNEAKRGTKPKQPLQDALGGLRKQIPPLSCAGRGPTWRPKSKKNWNKNNIKNHRICDHTFDAKNHRKWSTKSSKIDPKMVQNRFQKRAEAKNRKSVKTSNTPSFLVHFRYPRGSKIQQNSLKKWCRKRDQNQVRF